MKKLLTLILLSTALTVSAKDKPKELKDTVIKSVTYKLYEGSRGGKYYLKTSKTNNVYKVYIKTK